MNAELSTLTAIVAVVVPAAGAIASYAVLRERVNRHDRSIENLGQRLGAVEQAQAHQQGELSRPIHPGTEVRR